jgi:hypothetical protein
MRFVVDKVEMGQVYRRVLRLSPASSYSINAPFPRLSSWAAIIDPFANAIPRDHVSPYHKNYRKQIDKICTLGYAPSIEATGNCSALLKTK